MLEIGRWTRNVLTWVVWAPCTVGLVAGDTQCWPGACPTDGIYIGFGFRSGFGALWFGVCSADRWAVLHTSRPLHCRGVCEISLWSVGYVLGRSASDFGRVSGLVRVSLVGQAPELWNLHMYVNSHDQNIFFYYLFCSESLLFACCIMSCHVGNKLYWIELNWNWMPTLIYIYFEIFFSLESETKSPQHLDCGKSIPVTHWGKSDPRLGTTSSVISSSSIRRRYRYAILRCSGLL